MSDKKALSLLNIVIQLRKVCNHPELFERRQVSTPSRHRTLQSQL